MKLPARVLCYGSGLPLPRAIALRAGPLHVTFEGGDLRYVRLGAVEIIRRLYGAVRDQNWGTPPGIISDLRIERGKQSFEISYRSTHREGPLHFIWQATVRGEPSGLIRFEMKGKARSTFLRSRIGLCVLHPIRECSGVACEVEHNGSSATAIFPKHISPGIPIPGFHEMRGLSYEVAPHLEAQFRFEGDLFETEDQRNWTDASFKTFSTPANLPVPVEVKKGTTIFQSVTLRLAGRVLPFESEQSHPRVRIALSHSPSGRFPRIGLGTASHNQPLTLNDTKRLRALKLAHLRLDVDLSKHDWRQAFERGAGEARVLNVLLEVALFRCERDNLEDVADLVRQSQARVSTWLLFPASPNVVASMRGIFPGAKIATGTNADFYFLNQSPPNPDLVDCATFAIHPQTHASDNRSLVETLAIQSETVANARRLTGGLPVLVSPVTLKPRFNPDAIAPEPPPAAGELPSQVDPRQMSLFGAAWTLGSLKYLAEAGVFSVTLYETTGWRGVMELGGGTPLPSKFRSAPGGVFPLYHVLADVAEFAGGQIVPLHSSVPLAVDGLALRKAHRTRVILANLTGESQRIELRSAGRLIRARILDERVAMEAMKTPERFRARQGRSCDLRKLLLPRYALARIDLLEP